jgi:hypothetical protein
MKEVEICSAILLIVTGAMVFESGFGLISALCGLLLLGAGVFLYLYAVENLDESSPKKHKKKEERQSLEYL